MSGPKAVSYTVEELAAMREADELALENSRLRVAIAARDELAVECTAAAAVYGQTIAVPSVPSSRGRTAAELRRAVDELIEQTASARASLLALREESQRARLAEQLHAMGSLVIPARSVSEGVENTGAAEGAPAVRASAESQTTPLADRAAAYIAELEPGVELPDEVIALVTALGSSTASSAEFTMQEIHRAVLRANASARRRRRVESLLRELDERAGALANPVPLQAVARARAADTVSDAVIDQLVAEVEHAEQAERSERTRDYVEEIVRSILGAEGYEVLDGFETVVASGGVLVRRPGWHRHGLLVRVNDDEIGLAVVRTAAEPNASETTLRDIETETEMCDDLPAILDGIAARGINPGRIRRQQPGDTPVSVLEGAHDAAPSARRAKPKERKR